ncbi:DUF5305 domain-containing protein [Halobacteria archaeon AArc-m2/3/4]|uniref:DUF5305 domain-containing protein n=1 Tax=Natronoglomus mannanivorans TaxID=2979990 RepID=A0ABT2QHH6_9EURY|nr:DUF5305 domain-containing protein [Halobacteria archaeon AArc-m2/3/4]
MIDNPRVDLTIAKYGRSLVIALVVIGVLATVATGWVVANPDTSTTTQQVGSETVSTDLHTSAVVTQDGLWTEGTVLEDSSVYILNATPVLTVEPRTSVPTDDAAVSHELTVRYEATRNGEVFWEETDVILDTDATVEDGVATSEASIDMEALLERKHDLQREVGGVGSIDIVLDLDAEYDIGTAADTQTISAPVQLTERAYSLEGSLSASTSHPQTDEIEVTESANPFLVGGLALLATIAFGAATLTIVRSPVDVEAARQEVHKRRYAEWISHGTIPMWIGDHHVSLDSLEDVVDVAIDTHERVVHDRQRGLFAVVSDDVVYYYSNRGFWEETAWPDIDLDNQQPRSDLGAGFDADADPDSDSDAPQQAPLSAEDLPDPDDEDAWKQL